MNILKVLAGCLLVVGPFYGPTAVQCQTIESSTDIARSGFSLEMIVTKLQVLEYHILKTDLQMDERITALSSAVDSLVNTVDQHSRTVRWMGESVNSLEFDSKPIGQNLTAIQRELEDLRAGQEQLLTQQAFEKYIIDHGCNATSRPDGSGHREVNFTSCRNLPVNVTGIYQIQPEKHFKQPMTVLCDQGYGSGGWTVIQHRFVGSVNFYRGWKEYKEGFGSLEGEFWLGLDRIHQLTASRPHELLVLLEDYDGNKTYAKYDRFEIGDEGQKYVLAKIDGFSGTAGDSMGGVKGMKFTTLDSDNDTWDENCAVRYTGAWWYAACHRSNLNGKYLRGETAEYATGMVWSTFRGYHHALKVAKMMIRPLKS
uniref:Fibrinogen C-terminal domain-containing protein n=1 Tax=Anopheles atroparvus TaxID=41427 RepID=A0AAG5DC82_ANOAO